MYTEGEQIPELPSGSVSKEEIKILEHRLYDMRDDLLSHIHSRELILEQFNDVDITNESEVIAFLQRVQLTVKELERMADAILSQRRYLNQIERALYRIRKGIYGICAVTGKPISKERLWQFPHTALCVEALNRDEPKREDEYAIL